MKLFSRNLLKVPDSKSDKSSTSYWYGWFFLFIYLNLNLFIYLNLNLLIYLNMSIIMSNVFE